MKRAWLLADGLQACPLVPVSATTRLTSEVLSQGSLESRKDPTGKVAHLHLLKKEDAPCGSQGSSVNPPSYSCENLSPLSHID